MDANEETFIYMYIQTAAVDDSEDILIDGKPVFLSTHAVVRAREREIAYPDQVYSVLRTGSVVRFGKHGIKIIRRSKEGSIICVGEDVGHAIVIKTIERGN